MNKKEDFWKHIEKTETCWLWRGGLTSTGYGRFYYLGTNSRVLMIMQTFVWFMLLIGFFLKTRFTTKELLLEKKQMAEVPFA